MKFTIEEYLFELRQELEGSDKAILQDALADAHEHLSTALDEAVEENPEIDKQQALIEIIDQYGSPEETAAAYREIETRTATSFSSTPVTKESRGALARFFGIFNDTRAWGGMLFMLISLLLGILYFYWTLIALSITLVFILILSIFFRSVATFYLLSIDGLALLEGRIVEALLNIRMPRRPLVHPKDLPWKERLKHMITDKKTWKRFAYMLLSLPLGTLYFCVIIFMIALSLEGLAAPIVQEMFELPVINFGSQGYFIPAFAYPISILLGFLALTVTLHLARWVGSLHGRFAKFMLVE
jgi:uncharacterized membrane protein